MGSDTKPCYSLAAFLLLLSFTSSVPVADDTQFHTSLDNFGKTLFGELYQVKGSKNIIYSPLSIQTCLTMARMGAEGSTASEMDQYLGYTGKSLDSTAEQFQKLLSKYEKSNILNMANKVYVMKGYELQDTYNELLSDKFYSPAENVNFGENTKAAEIMNNWVETKTNNAINNLIDPDNVDGSTRLFLLSAIHFKGNWKLRFDAKHTREDDFYIDATHSVKVPMMYRSGMTDFGWDSELKAGVLRLPYENSDLSMLIVLPQERDGLSAVLEKLKGISLKSLTKGLTSSREMILYLPKFKAEFDIELNDVLKKIGMKQMFESGDFSKMLKTPEPLTISHVVHKAVIEVNEEGTEAAAATAGGVVAYSGPPTFKADHPFYYVIMNEDSVPLFEGTFIGV